jgi:2'-5' RNA ligase
MEIRSFLAFKLPPDIKNIIRRVSDNLRKMPAEVKWVKTDNIHLTIVFLGQVKGTELEGVKGAAGAVCAEFGPFEVALEGVGCFPNRRRPRVLWLGLKADLDRLNAFRDALQEGLKPFGIKEEKRLFRPHLTLGRIRKPGKMARSFEDRFFEYHDLGSADYLLSDLILFKSTLKPGGAEYSGLAAWPLSGQK